MNKKENLFTTTLRLNLNNAQDMEAWNNLMSTDRKTETSLNTAHTAERSSPPSTIISPDRIAWRSNRNGKQHC